MNKRASTPFLMWLVVILLHAHLHLSIEAVSKSNDSTSECDGSVEECLNLNIHHLDSQLPTISTSHLSRILAEANKYSSLKSEISKSPSFCSNNNGYKDCLASYQGSSTCNDIHKRDCHYV
ncbi:hypothetical protein Fmac_017409 [Flemingia macrophylla]|uniref:Uncharacterized protein n=1 Tax=Flemingia macrophylla TaxID=520843 RepID=A0ABD1M233_9FABA